MFVVISFILSAVILATFYYYSQIRENSNHSKHTTVTYLRQIVHLCRQHRAATHDALAKGQHNSDIDAISQLLDDTMQQLLSEVGLTDKPIYRILQTKLKKLTDSWYSISISQNQINHGRVIRHCLLLIDEIMITWVLEAQKQELSNEYHHNWHQVIDSLDSLTQFRVTIQDLGSEHGNTRIKYLSETLHRRLKKLGMINPVVMSSPNFQVLCTRLEAITDTEDAQLSSESLYQLSSDISLMIFNIYDYILADVAENVYVPLPKLAIPV
ncbi:hypothetical protein DI392_01690 [Vibrio albus]|jgi:hypothetical protein|uniref:Nitrate/nitrite sensing protein domain-containing protein n=1 Tax=Vibrio albus TaxID=2200953 RepID=A0A2U3BDY8_9VIBR|nr:hypothetical protein [Vibrio albus]PWI35018.1 hypothetical protein DI392_01690 [Vibrio albus]